MNIGIYIHIPFCKQKCFYCDFLSFPNKESYFEAYKNALINEIKTCEHLDDAKIDTIFIGGGTPTVINPNYIDEILKEVFKKNVLPNAEITIESNPGTLNEKMLKSLLNSGVNRLSIGLQAIQNRLLKKIGRIHTYEDFLKNYNEAIKIGFSNINIDLMFSLPEQTLEDWIETLYAIIDLKPKHISTYSLIVEENTYLSKLYDKGELTLNNVDIDREMYLYAQKYLEEYNYLQYEISNFSLPGYNCIHNIKYWERDNYLGFGLGAHSFFNNFRYNDINDLNKYILLRGDKTLVIENKFFVYEKEAMEEFMFLGLRMKKGIDINKFYKCFNKDIYSIFGNIINKYKSQGFLIIDNDRILLSNKGIDVSNIIFSDFLLNKF